MIFPTTCLSAEGKDGDLYEHNDYYKYTLIEETPQTGARLARAFYGQEETNRFIESIIKAVEERKERDHDLYFRYHIESPDEVIERSGLSIKTHYLDAHLSYDVVLIEQEYFYIISCKTKERAIDILYKKNEDAVLRANLVMHEMWSGNRLTLGGALDRVIISQRERLKSDIAKIKQFGNRFRITMSKFDGGLFIKEELGHLPVFHLVEQSDLN